MCKPTSTNAPKSVIFLTTPSSSSPILSSVISITLLAKTGGARSSLGSCPGFWSSFRISVRVSGQRAYVVERCVRFMVKRRK